MSGNSEAKSNYETLEEDDGTTFNQFDGKKTSYHDDIYTTKLDTSNTS